MSNSTVPPTSTDSKNTAAAIPQPPGWALVLAGSEEEPERVGEVAPLPINKTLIFGRGGTTNEFIQLGIQRPGEPFRPIVRPDAALFAGTLLSREQASFRATPEGVKVENRGSCAMLVNGEEVETATLVEGDTVRFRTRGVLANRSVLLFLVQKRPRVLVGPPATHPFGEPDASGIVGEGPAAWDLRAQIVNAARAKARKILVLGESGTGKEATSNAIHALSPRAKGPFVARNAATITLSIADTELFGHPAGFPDARSPERMGLFRQADGGTLFFDEVADCHVEVLPRLLRVLDDGEYQRVSEPVTRHADVRFIGATNRDLAVARPEVYARFQLIVRLAPLRARREDIPLLVRNWAFERFEGDEALTERYMQRGATGKLEPKINLRLVDHLLHQEFELNVRELYNFLESCLSNPENDIRLPLEKDAERTALPQEGRATGAGEGGDGGGVDDIPDNGEPSKGKLVAYLDRARGNVSEVARELGVGRKVVTRLMKKYEIKGDGGEA
jgi:DNA-binding NtrC family response regulator